MSELSEKHREPMAHAAHGSKEINIFDLLIILMRYKKFVIGMPIVLGIIFLIISLLMTPVFTSAAKIMPPQQQSSGASALLGQLGLGAIAGASGIAGLKNPNDLYVGILQSRTVADNLINQFNLTTYYEAETKDDTRRILKGATSIGSGKDGLISIEVQDKDPKFAAELANAYVKQLINLMKSLAVTEAAQRRMFFENQMKSAKDQLADAEAAMRQMQEKTGMIQLNGQVQGIINSIAQLKATIAAKEVQMAAMRTYATNNNPDLLRVGEEIRTLKMQLDKLQKAQQLDEGDMFVSTAKIPEVGVKYVRAVRDVKYFETIFELLARQYELAKIDEAKDSMLIQQLDVAVPAEKKTGPKRAYITLGGFIGGGVLGVLLAFFHNAYLWFRLNNERFRSRNMKAS